MMKNSLRLTLICLCIYAVTAAAQMSDLDTALGDSYYYTDHFEVIIDKPVSDVWPHILTMGRWMPWMATKGSSGGAISEGKKVKLYGDNYIEVVKIIPQKMILLAHHPSTQEGESSQGVAMVSVIEANGETLVSIFMSRLYSWFEAAPNKQRLTRESEDFAKQRKEVFQGNFLEKLRKLTKENGS